jgi:hypothetical protein
MRRWAPLLLMVASGFAGLGCQIVWTQQCSSLLGHESAAVLAVVAAFFGGLALGGLIFGPRIERSVRSCSWHTTHTHPFQSRLTFFGATEGQGLQRSSLWLKAPPLPPPP